MPDDVDVDALLAQAKEAAEGRERWRKSGPIFAALIAAKVPYKTITEVTGVQAATFARHARLGRSNTSASTRCSAST